MKTFNYIARLTLFLAFVVIVLGAYVRLSDAGLGCPDWPTCYGQLLVPETSELIDDSFRDQESQQLTRELEPDKAWKEMIHRYLASGLGLLILLLAGLAIKNRKNPNQPFYVPLFLVGLVIFQGMLGMWTVTLLLKPVIVTAHLLGGVTTLAFLTWLVMASKTRRVNQQVFPVSGFLKGFSVFALLILFIQIFLGGWTSSNYAAMICPDFPTCQNHWWPAMNFKEGFTLWRGVGIDYEFGVLKADARTAIHMTHRIGAIITFLSIFSLVLIALQQRSAAVRGAAKMLGCFLFIQVALGIANIKLGLPLHVAVSHNAVAALLLVSMTVFLYQVFKAEK